MVPLLTVRRLSSSYGARQVFVNLNLDVMRGEILLLTGGNGSGKSTLLKVIYGLKRPQNADAEILFRPNEDTSAVETTQPSVNLQRGLAYLSQTNSVFDDLTVDENLLLSSHTLATRKEFDVRREEVLQVLPMLKRLRKHRLDQMSGGERQLTALAMLLIHRPKLLLLDEPTAGLAESLATNICHVLATLRASTGCTILLVEHRIALVAPFASRSLMLRGGRLVDPSYPTQESL
jgi:ABC-type branched-subunit amino acid transport system ATPase component